MVCRKFASAQDSSIVSARHHRMIIRTYILTWENWTRSCVHIARHCSASITTEFPKRIIATIMDEARSRIASRLWDLFFPTADRLLWVGSGHANLVTQSWRSLRKRVRPYR